MRRKKTSEPEPPEVVVVPLPHGLSAVYFLRPKPAKSQPVDPSPELLEQAPWLLTSEEDPCPF